MADQDPGLDEYNTYTHAQYGANQGNYPNHGNHYPQANPAPYPAQQTYPAPEAYPAPVNAYGVPSNYGNQTPDTEPKGPTAGQSEAEAVSIRSNGPETELKKTLEERHVNMIGFSVVLGVGLFLSAGKVIFIAGPGLAVLAYLLMGTLMWSAMASMGEMTALFPVKGPTFEFTRRFVDESVGYASAWMLWFCYVVVAAAEILSVTEIFRFRVDEDYLRDVGYPSETVEWSFGVGTNPAVWVGIFLVVILVMNLLPVKQYGQFEYIFGSVKISFLVALIMINTVLNARKMFHSSRFWTYEDPWGFSSANITVKATPSDGHPDGIVYGGALGTITAFWTAMVTSFFSLMGWDIILLTAPENKDLAREETIKISSRKIALRVILLYALAVFTVGLNVPYTDVGLRNLTLNGITGGQTSIFVLAAIREHVPVLPYFLNGFFVFSATTTGINSLYSASRILHAIASLRDAWPRWGWVESIRSRLEHTHYGVPIGAVFASWFLAFLSFLSTRPSSTEILGRMTTVAATSTLIVYALNCFTFLLFFKETKKAKNGDRDEDLNLTPELRYQYDRKNKWQYPYHSHLQWMRALYGMVFCILMIIFQGWRTLVPPISVEDFVASYVSILIFIVLSTAYFFKSRGFNPANWHRRAQKLAGLEAIGPVVAAHPNHRDPCKHCGMRHRRGRLVLPDGPGRHKQKTVAVLEWIWTWLK
ncbi:amino acid permease-domain-containing protein [Cercophora scortea]|uniref:Amino acid permease-domain-containing protein n=1 Tax=Cercophora scortea TaxID=314031 RepID=A0AAE0IGG9_9PEZI|nr:amino acid permease-domain-containing protein [Cercophora scortea]